MTTEDSSPDNDSKPVSEKRQPSDRRGHPTHILSRYTLSGRRSSFRRKEDRARGGYVDRYSSGLLLLLVILLVLNALDAIFTIFILDCGGREVNPLMEILVAYCGERFWIWKFLLVGVSVLFLCLHSQFPRVKSALWVVTLLYGGVILYQAYLIFFRIVPNLS
jgi:hypothetical protein